ncbi:Ubiquitin fusion degradation protein 1-like protein [Yarrowia sp. C11]|nr:Ubiquitin fusion degradation protein 1-like protein [Yarrowia sp. E02]KAG5367587.1 Ubiquitin fusion degradation protein 1-like protein [Yarrowia sp. C11]
MKLTTYTSPNKYSDKITLPADVLDSLIAEFGDDLPRPLLFNLKSRDKSHVNTATVGVKEFTAEPGTVGVPQVVLDNLNTNEGVTVDVSVSRDTPLATDMTLKPLDQYQVDNYEALLEAALRANYTALTVGQNIVIRNPSDASRDLEFVVDSLSPASTVCIVDTDVNLDVLVPVGVGSEKSASEKSASADISSLDFSSISSLPFSSGPTKAKISLEKFTHVSVSSSRAFVGVSQDTSPFSFIWSTLEAGSVDIPASNPFGQELYIWNEGEMKVDNHVVEVEDAEMSDDGPPDTTKCPTCNSYIPNQSYTLHSNFCARNNTPCEHFDVCGHVFKRGDGTRETHWHCEHCDQFGNSLESRETHVHYSHTEPEPCVCGFQTSNYTSLALHKHTECPLSLHECRFCHLRVPRDVASARDLISGYSGHESSCGAKTTDCHVCKKPVRLRDLLSHQKLHTLATRDKIAPELCSNTLCIRSRGNNSLELCDTCFGPLYSSVNDPTGSRLKSRVERRYVLQLTKGCGKSSCRNSYCVSSGLLAKPSMAQVMALIKEISAPTFCVDEKTTKRKNFVDFQAENSQYSREWLSVAIEENKGNEQEAVKWLEYNAPKVVVV